MKKQLLNGFSIAAITLTLSVLGNALGERGAPAAQMMLGIVVGGIISQLGKVSLELSRATSIGTSAILGVLMGTYLPIDKLEHMGLSTAYVIALATFTMVIGIAFSRMLTQIGHVDTETAVLGMLPGGSAAVVSASTEIGAQSDLVAFMQYIRVVIVATCAPFVFSLMDANKEYENSVAPPHPPLWVDVVRIIKEYAHSAITKEQILGLSITAAIALAGYAIGKIIGIPSPGLLGSMFLSMLVTSIQICPDYAPVGLWKDLLFVLVGLEVGLKFHKSSVKQALSILPLILVCVLGTCVVTGILAVLLANFLHLNEPSIYLATTPGGINAVIGTAQGSDTDLTLITTAQSFRLICSLMLLPILVHLTSMKKKKSRQNPDKHSHNDHEDLTVDEVDHPTIANAHE